VAVHFDGAVLDRERFAEGHGDARRYLGEASIRGGCRADELGVRLRAWNREKAHEDAGEQGEDTPSPPVHDPLADGVGDAVAVAVHVPRTPPSSDSRVVVTPDTVLPSGSSEAVAVGRTLVRPFDPSAQSSALVAADVEDEALALGVAPLLGLPTTTVVPPVFAADGLPVVGADALVGPAVGLVGIPVGTVLL
jgi:hypothetical protein